MCVCIDLERFSGRREYKTFGKPTSIRKNNIIIKQDFIMLKMCDYLKTLVNKSN